MSGNAEQKDDDQPVPYEEGKENSHQDNDSSEQHPLHSTAPAVEK
jgi:hypothetical protein